MQDEDYDGGKKRPQVCEDLADAVAAAEAEKVMRGAGCWFLFLPPDSPDLNPTEEVSQSSVHTRAGSERAQSWTRSTQPLKSPTWTHPTYVGTTSRLLDLARVIPVAPTFDSRGISSAMVL